VTSNFLITEDADYTEKYNHKEVQKTQRKLATEHTELTERFTDRITGFTQIYFTAGDAESAESF